MNLKTGITCLNCHYEFQAHTDPRHIDHTPTPGDYSVCIRCTSIAVYDLEPGTTDQIGIREPTAAELGIALADDHITETRRSIDTRFDPDEFNQTFVPALAAGDRDAMTDWMTSHLFSRMAHAQFLETLPRVASTAIRVLTGRKVDAPGEGWGMGRPPGAEVRQASDQAGQMIVAALNADQDVITGIVKAVLDSPMEHVVAVELALITNCHMVLKDVGYDR